MVHWECTCSPHIKIVYLDPAVVYRTGPKLGPIGNFTCPRPLAAPSLRRALATPPLPAYCLASCREAGPKRPRLSPRGQRRSRLRGTSDLCATQLRHGAVEGMGARQTEAKQDLAVVRQPRFLSSIGQLPKEVGLAS